MPDFILGKWLFIGAQKADLNLSGFRKGLEQTRAEIAAAHGEREAKRLDEILFGYDEEMRALNATATATPA